MNRLLLRTLAALATFIPVAVANAQRVGLIVVAHGADSAWNAGVRQTVSQVKWTSGPVRTAWLMGEDAKAESWDAAVQELERAGVERIVAVPFMVSTFGSHVRQVEYFAGLRAELPAELRQMMGGHDHAMHVKASVPISVTPALDNAAELGEALANRWNTLAAPDRARPLMLIAHGPNDAADAVVWERNIMSVAKVLSDKIAPHPVRVGLMRDDADAATRAASVAAFRAEIAKMSSAARDSVLVLPVLISTGAINHAKLPADLAGTPARYFPVGLTPSAPLARWIERVAARALDDLNENVQGRTPLLMR
jgi:sirohydrochlorin ferrochelatase